MWLRADWHDSRTVVPEFAFVDVILLSPLTSEVGVSACIAMLLRVSG